MVLINELTIEQINAALLHLQRSKDEVVGGVKGTTIQNISISNSGGGGNNVDYSGTIKTLATNIEKNKTAIEKNASDISKLKSDMANIEKSVEDTLQGLVDNGISDLSFDPLTKQLTITTNAGDTYQTTIEQDIGYLSFDSATNKLTLTTGEQTQDITLPYINSSEKGSANGVATLDENGRVPYSQLPESAMEFLGQWDASTNTPHLEDGTGTNGDFYIVSAGGTVNLGTAQDPHIVTFSVNDRIVYEGDIAQWVRLPAGQVSSVNGQSGVVTLTANDIEYSTGVSIKDKIDANAVQSDWNVTDTTSLAYIKNKPTIPASPVQSDWNVTDTTSLAYIKNKPTIPSTPTLVCCAKCLYSTCYNDVSINWRPDSSTYYTTASYQTAGNEALVFATSCAATSFIFVNGENSVANHANNRWQSLTPGLQIKCNKVTINKLIASGTAPTYELEVNGTVCATCYCGDLDGIVTRCGSVNGGYYATVSQPANTYHYVLVNVGSSYGGNVVAQIYNSKYFINKSDSTTRVVSEGGGYGGFAYSHLGSEASPSTCIWLRFTGWRPMMLCGEFPITIVCNTTTAPSGITFSSPAFAVGQSLYLNGSAISCTTTANNEVGLAYASYNTSDMPGTYGNVIQMQTGTGSSSRWGYQLAFPTSGIPRYRRWTNTTSIGGWNSFITSENISTQHVACADHATCADNTSSTDAVYDKLNGTKTYLAYGCAGLTANPSWLAAWNGYELRAISPACVCVGCTYFACVSQRTQDGISRRSTFSSEIREVACGLFLVDIRGCGIRQCSLYCMFDCFFTSELGAGYLQDYCSRFETGFIGYMTGRDSCSQACDIGVIFINNSELRFYNNNDNLEYTACKTATDYLSLCPFGRQIQGYFSALKMRSSG